MVNFILQGNYYPASIESVSPNKNRRGLDNSQKSTTVIKGRYEIDMKRFKGSSDDTSEGYSKAV